MSRRTHCRYGHELTPLTTLTQVKLCHSNGRWYVVRSCRMCRSVEASIRWYAGKHSNGKYRYRGQVPPTVEEITRRVERRWARRLKNAEDPLGGATDSGGLCV